MVIIHCFLNNFVINVDIEPSSRLSCLWHQITSECVFSNVLMQNQRHENRKTSDWSKSVVRSDVFRFSCRWFCINTFENTHSDVIWCHKHDRRDDGSMSTLMTKLLRKQWIITICPLVSDCTIGYNFSVSSNTRLKSRRKILSHSIYVSAKIHFDTFYSKQDIAVGIFHLRTNHFLTSQMFFDYRVASLSSTHSKTRQSDVIGCCEHRIRDHGSISTLLTKLLKTLTLRYRCRYLPCTEQALFDQSDVFRFSCRWFCINTFENTHSDVIWCHKHDRRDDGSMSTLMTKLLRKQWIITICPLVSDCTIGYNFSVSSNTRLKSRRKIQSHSIYVSAKIHFVTFYSKQDIAVGIFHVRNNHFLTSQMFFDYRVASLSSTHSKTRQSDVIGCREHRIRDHGSISTLLTKLLKTLTLRYRCRYHPCTEQHFLTNQMFFDSHVAGFASTHSKTRIRM